MDETDQLLPLCFVLMALRRKMDVAGRVTNFDAVYSKIIAPAVSQAGLEPIRADEEKIGGPIHKSMFERLMLCHYAVADITGAQRRRCGRLLPPPARQRDNLDRPARFRLARDQTLALLLRRRRDHKRPSRGMNACDPGS